MRWDDLFEDLAGQFDAEYDQERRRQAVEDERLRVARITLRQRLLALEVALAPGEYVLLELRSGERLQIVPVEFGADWFAARLTTPTRHYASVLIPLRGISSLLLTRDQITASLQAGVDRPQSLAGRLGFTIPLRDLARRRVHCELTTPVGVLPGTIDRVGRDHLDLAVHEGDTARRDGAVNVLRVVPLDEIQLVRASDA